MGLSDSLEIGRSGLIASQSGLQVAGNNLTNSATAGYHRQTLSLATAPSQQVQPGVFIGRGVLVQNVVRQIDSALESRLRTAIADQSASQTRQDTLTQIEAAQNELSGTDLSTKLGTFFDSWSQLANNPLDSSQQSLVVQQGASLASFLSDQRTALVNLRNETDKSIDNAAKNVNDLLSQIATLNKQVVSSDNGTPGAEQGLRDQRDALLSQLSQYLDISTVEQPTGSLDVFAGSQPLILNNKSNGVEIQRDSVNGDLTAKLVVSSDKSTVTTTKGSLGALVDARGNDINGAIQQIDQFTNQLIFEVNKIHSTGQGTSGATNIVSDQRVLDPNAALNSTAAGLGFTPQQGSFQIRVTQKSTGQSTLTSIPVTLDGITPSAQTTLTSLATALNGVSNIKASVTADNRLKITADGGFEISFDNDTSNTLAALGVNGFFKGTNATNIAVSDAVSANPSLLASGQGGVSGDNSNALALSALRDKSVTALGNASLTQAWSNHVADFAQRLGDAKAQATSDTTVRASLSSQQQSISGVNVDEETINLLSYQRSYQASARFITIVDQLMQTLLALTG